MLLVEAKNKKAENTSSAMNSLNKWNIFGKNIFGNHCYMKLQTTKRVMIWECCNLVNDFFNILRKFEMTTTKF